MSHACTYRIFLRKAGKSRMAIMVDSPHHAYSQVKFTITEKGVENAEAKTPVDDSNESGW